ncbi:MAG: SMP-30/gluconolactonase/LRE family protein [Chloroflexi bacterium]|nr:SMP-30/gluconolactonase/LRE family protein [Chloroflexota bacterium]
MPTTPEMIANYACEVGENPLWNTLDNHVYWLDIPKGTIFRFDPATAVHEVFYRGAVMGGFTFQADGALLVFGVGGKIQRLQDGQLTTLYDALPGEEGNRFNDVSADPAGRVLCGTMPYGEGSAFGSLYLLELDGTIRKLRDQIRLSNGMGFSPDLKTLYHVDSLNYTITQFAYDRVSGDIAEPRPFATLPAEIGFPDGMTVDAEGFIWLAVWDGSRLIRYDPQGKIERQIMFPVKKVSSLTFAGDDYADIYATSAGGEKPEENGALAGALFRLRLGIRGKPEYFSRVRL